MIPEARTTVYYYPLFLCWWVLPADEFLNLTSSTSRWCPCKQMGDSPSPQKAFLWSVVCSFLHLQLHTYQLSWQCLGIYWGTWITKAFRIRRSFHRVSSIGLALPRHSFFEDSNSTFRQERDPLNSHFSVRFHPILPTSIFCRQSCIKMRGQPQTMVLVWAPGIHMASGYIEMNHQTWQLLPHPLWIGFQIKEERKTYTTCKCSHREHTIA
jgi:hypothetical protein